MLDPDSRYAGQTVLVYTNSDGREIRYLRRRPIAPADSFTTLTEVEVHDGARLDLITARVLGSPSQWWRVADANESMDPTDLVSTPGRKLRVPSPI